MANPFLASPSVQHIVLDRITIGTRHRRVERNDTLDGAIRLMGHQLPIAVRRVEVAGGEPTFELIDGEYRLRKARERGDAAIIAVVLDVPDDLTAEALQIFAHVAQSPPDMIDVVLMAARLKEIYLGEVGDARGGRAGGLARQGRTTPPSFAERFGGAFGKSRTSMNRYAQIGEALGGAVVEVIRNAPAPRFQHHKPLQDDFTSLNKLAGVKDDDERLALATTMAAERCKMPMALRHLVNKQLTENPHPLTSHGRGDVVVLDPPWDQDPSRRPYPAQSLDEIKALDIDAHAKGDCVLFLHTPYSYLTAAHEVLAAYGFEAQAMITWEKANTAHPGSNDFVKNNAEYILVATRGNPALPVERIHAVQHWPTPVRSDGGFEHSRKPEEFYAEVDRLYPGRVKVELHARSQRKGWICVGLECDKFAA